MKGELDWVVLKALEKDRSRRYDTANGLARDLQRYLADEVVEARPPSTGYRIKKFVRRHKGQALAASLVLQALLGGVVGTTVGLIEAKKQERFAIVAAEEARKAKQDAEVEKANALKAAEAERAAKLDADTKRQEAERNLAFARKGNGILGSVFAGLDPKKIAESGRPLQDMLCENLEKSVKELEGSAIGDPLEVAAMQNTLGLSLLGLGEANLAIDVFGKSLATRKERLGAEHHQTLESMVNLAQCYRAAGMLDKALPLIEESHKLGIANLGTDHQTTLISLNDLAISYADTGKIDQALPLFETVLKLRTAKLGANHPSTLSAMGNLAEGYQAAGKWDKALPLYEEALKLRTAKLGADHPETLAAMGALAKGCKAIGKLDQALPLLEESLRLRTVKLGADHPQTLEAMNDLAAGYQVAGRIDQALPLYEATLKLRTGKLGADHPNTLISMNNLAVGYQVAGKLDQALPLYEETLQLITAKLGADHPLTLQSMSHLAGCYSELKRPSKSIALFEESLKGLEARLGRQHPTTLWTVANLGVNYNEAGRQMEAIPLLEEAYRASKKYPKLRFVADHLRNAYSTAGETTKYVNLVQEQLADARQSLPKDSPQLADRLAHFGFGLMLQQKWTEAEPMLREALAIREKAQPDLWSTFNTQSMLGGALLEQKKYADAEPLLIKGYEGMKQREKTILANGQHNIPRALDRLIQLYTETNRPDELKKWQTEKAKRLEAAPKPAATKPGL